MAEHNEKRDNLLRSLQDGVKKEGLKRVKLKYMNAGGKGPKESRKLSRDEVEALVSIDNAIKLKQKAGPDGEFNRV